MSLNLEIQLLKGFCNFSFGQIVSEAETLFGPAEEAQTLEDDILETSSYVLHYWSQGYSLFFDKSKGNTFTSVEVDNKETLLFKQKPFNMNEKTLTELLKTTGYKLTETENHSWGEKRLSFDDAGLDCYFENGRLISINFGVANFGNNFSYFPN